jgi:hypothetical protein
MAQTTARVAPNTASLRAEVEKVRLFVRIYTYFHPHPPVPLGDASYSYVLKLRAKIAQVTSERDGFRDRLEE